MRWRWVGLFGGVPWGEKGEEGGNERYIVNTYVVDPCSRETPTPTPTATAATEKSILIDKRIQNVFRLRPNMGGFILVLVLGWWPDPGGHRDELGSVLESGGRLCW